LVLLHGFTQNARCWGPFSEVVGEGRLRVAVDLPGHGDSSLLRADLWQTARAVADVCGRADYIGYSLGARVLLHIALARSDVVERAVLIGATAGIEDEGDSAERLDADEALARELDSAVGDKKAFEEFLDRWLAGPLFAGLDETMSCKEARMGNDPAGLASSLRSCGTGSQRALWARVGEIAVPVLVLAGERDERFTKLGARLASQIGDNAHFCAVPRAGHACHLERPAETAALVRQFFGDPLLAGEPPPLEGSAPPKVDRPPRVC